MVSSLANLTAHEHSALGQKLRLELHRKRLAQQAARRRVFELVSLAVTIAGLCATAVVLDRERQLDHLQPQVERYR